MAEIYTPPAHPGELIGEELYRRGMTSKLAAELLGVKVVPLRRIITGHCKLSPEIAYRLELAGVGTMREWLMRQVEYNLWVVSISKEFDVKPFPPVMPEKIHAEEAAR